MKEPFSYTFQFSVECREEGDSLPPGGRRRQPDTLTMPKIMVAAELPSDAPLAPPRNVDTGLRARPSHVELIVPPADLEQDGGQRFRQKIAAVLADGAGAIVVNLLSGPTPSEAAIALLVQARDAASSQGIRLVVRPVAPARREQLRQRGL